MAGDAAGDEVHLDLGGKVMGNAMQVNYAHTVYMGQAPDSPSPPALPGDAVFIATAVGEQNLAKQLMAPLRAAGHRVADSPITIDVTGVETAGRVLEAGRVLVLCATVRAIGTRWTREMIDSGDRERIFVVQLDDDADLTHLTERVLVVEAVERLVEVVTAQFPPEGVVAEQVLAAGDDQRPLLERPTDCGTFDFHELQRFRQDLRDEVIDEYPHSLSSWEFLERAGLWTNGRLTGTGALLFSTRRPARLAASVICTSYEGTDRTGRRDSRTFEDCLPEQIRAARRFVADRVRVGELPSADQSQSQTDYQYPMVAVREIIANALVHRDYSNINACVHVRLFSDRLEVSSPGEWIGFPDGDEHSFADLRKQSWKRNFQLARVLTWIKLVEGEGSGVPIAVQDCAAHDCPAPTVTQEQGFVVVTLYRRPERGLTGHGHVRPAMLPSGTSLFVGRNAELTMLDDVLESGPRACVVHGMPGIGKTELVLQWARRAADHFPDGQLYVDLRGYGPDEPMRPAEALSGFLTALGVEPQMIPDAVDARAALFRSLLAERRLLVVLDNALETAQVRPLLVGDGDSLVVITSRARMSGLAVREGAYFILVDALPLTAARRLLTKLLGEERVIAEPDAAESLIQLTAHLPLALRIVAALTNSVGSLETLAEELRQSRQALDTDDSTASVTNVFSWSYRRLTPEAAATFRTLALHPGPHADIPVVAAMLNITQADARWRVRELTRAHMLVEPEPDRFWYHDLLRAYAQDTAAHDGTPDGAERRMLTHYLTNTGEHGTVLNMINYASSHGFDELVWQLAWEIAPALDQGGRWRDWIASHQTALNAAERTGDTAVQARTHHGLGTAYSRCGQYAEALHHHDRALDQFRAVGDQLDESRAHLAISEINEHQGRYTEALTHLQQAWQLSRSIRDTSGEAGALNLLGWWHARLGRYDQALTHCEQALELFRALADRRGEASVMDHLGYIHHHLGDHTQAANAYLHALDLWQEFGDRYNEAITRAHLGDTQSAIGDQATATDLWTKALTVLSEFDDPDAETLRAKLYLDRSRVV